MIGGEAPDEEVGDAGAHEKGVEGFEVVDDGGEDGQHLLDGADVLVVLGVQEL